MILVLDASAVLALLLQECGSDKIKSLLQTHAQSVMINTVNYSEVIARLIQRGLPAIEAKQSVDSLAISVVDLHEEIAYRAACLVVKTRKYGLSLADRICLATGQILKGKIITADQVWKKAFPKLDIEVIR